MSFVDKVVLVTGGSSGIGAATAISFAGERARVCIVGRNAVKLAEVSEKCEKKGSKPLVVVADLTKDEDVRRVVATTIQCFGKLNILVNGAGIYRSSCILDHDVMLNFDRVMKINLRATVSITNIASPYLVHTKGNIVNIGSIGSKSVVRNSGTFAFCASKAAIEIFTKCIASELASRGVRVNAVNPGTVKTDIIKNMGVHDDRVLDMVWQTLKEGTVLERLSEPEEIAELVLFLASDKAKGMTGTTIVHDNGALLKEIQEM